MVCPGLAVPPHPPQPCPSPSTDRVVRMIMKMARVARSRKLGILHPAFHMSRYLRTELHKDLPDNVHQLVSGRLGISLTRVADGKNVLVSHFRTKSEVVDVSGGGGWAGSEKGSLPPRPTRDPSSPTLSPCPHCSSTPPLPWAGPRSQER